MDSAQNLPNSGVRLKGVEVTLTGAFARVSRAELAAAIRAHQGRVSRRLTANTGIVVVGEQTLPVRRDGRINRKLESALKRREAGQRLEILREPEFLARLGLIDPDAGFVRRYTLQQLSETAGVPRRRIQQWLRAGLIQPVEVVHGVRLFDFRQVSLVKLFCQLWKAGVGTRRLRKSLSDLRGWLPDAHDALGKLDVLEGLLVLRTPEGRAANTAGQLFLEFDEDDQAEPESLPLEVSRSPDDLFAEAVALEQAEEWEAAAEMYRQWLREFGPDAEVCFNLGNALRASGRIEGAIERFRQSLELDPGAPDAWNNLGEALAADGDLPAACEAWERALRIDPRDPRALYNLADALQESGREEEARPYWEAYLQLDVDSEWAQYARSCLQPRLA